MCQPLAPRAQTDEAVHALRAVTDHLCSSAVPLAIDVADCWRTYEVRRGAGSRRRGDGAGWKGRDRGWEGAACMRACVRATGPKEIGFRFSIPSQFGSRLAAAERTRLMRWLIDSLVEQWSERLIDSLVDTQLTSRARLPASPRPQLLTVLVRMHLRLIDRYVDGLLSVSVLPCPQLLTVLVRIGSPKYPWRRALLDPHLSLLLALVRRVGGQGW